MYNEEEVKELFEVVFNLSAKDAKDAVKPDEKVSVKLIIGSENGQAFADFQHNGNPFRYQDAKKLVFPYSYKGDEENSDKSGRFGTSFLATHIL